VTVSSGRYEKKKRGRPFRDESGDLAEKIIRNRGHTLESRRLIPDKRELITKTLRDFLRGKSDVVVFMGGTGVSSRDVTIETVEPHFEKELEGFGELFRAISFRKIGTAAALSRATAGVKRGKLLLCLPGSPDAVKTALELFVGEFPHIISIARS
jgi:molybdenum cofactor biosynthesis protein B